MKADTIERPITTDPAPDYLPGDCVMYRDDPNNLWTIGSIKPGAKSWWVWAEQNGTKQNFPAGVFSKVEKKQKQASVPAVAKTEPKPKRKEMNGDVIARLLAEAEDVAACWRIAEMAGLDIAATKEKIGHLSNGLQRMGLGNRLRKMWKDGQFDPESIVCNGVGAATDFVFKNDCPDFTDEE